MDKALLAQVRQALEQMMQAERDAGVARAEFLRAVRLILHGSRPQDVAAALGLSDQQFQEILQQAGSSEGQDRGDAADTGLLVCSFCGRSQRKVRKMIAGPGVYICGGCVELAAGVASTGTASGTRLGAVHAVPEQDRQVRCTFCGKGRDQVAGLVAVADGTGGEGPEPAAICTECLSLCTEIITEELA